MGNIKAGCIVIRDANGVYELLLVSSRSNPHEWILPKGSVEKLKAEGKMEDLAIAAARETQEEAGVLGTVGPEVYVERIRDTKTHYFVMNWTGYSDDWLERDQRRRSWRPVMEWMPSISKTRPGISNALLAIHTHLSQQTSK